MVISQAQRAEAAVTRMLATVGDCSAADLRRDLETSKAIESKLAAYQARAAATLAALERHGDGGAGVLRHATGVSRRQAESQVRTARVLEDMPTVREALEEGRVSFANAARLAQAAEGTESGAVEADAGLLAKAESMTDDQFAREARRWTAGRQPDDGEADYQRRRARRWLRLWDGDDGMTQLRGELDPVTGERIRNRLEAEARRLRTTDAGAGGGAGGGGGAAGGGKRTFPQAMADALDGLTATGSTVGRPTVESNPDSSDAPTARSTRTNRDGSGGSGTPEEGDNHSPSSTRTNRDNNGGSSGSSSGTPEEGDNHSPGPSSTRTNRDNSSGTPEEGDNHSPGPSSTRTNRDNNGGSGSSAAGPNDTNPDAANNTNHSSRRDPDDSDAASASGSVGEAGHGSNGSSRDADGRTGGEAGANREDRGTQDGSGGSGGTTTGTPGEGEPGSNRGSRGNGGARSGGGRGTRGRRTSGGGGDTCSCGRRKSNVGPIADIAVVSHVDPGTGQLVSQLATGEPLPPSVLDLLSCNAALTGVLYDTAGTPLWRGTTKRTATAAQLRALIARDGGCIGCHIHPALCQAHHIRPVAQGGPTTIANMALLCWHCHNKVHHNQWAVRRRNGRLVLEPPIRTRLGPARAP